MYKPYAKLFARYVVEAQKEPISIFGIRKMHADHRYFLKYFLVVLLLRINFVLDISFGR